MKKTTKHFLGFITLLLFCIILVGMSIIWMAIVDQFQSQIHASPLVIRIIFGLTLYITILSTGIFGPLFLVLSFYINGVSLLELKFYLQGLDERDAVKFLARLIWLSNINVRKYPNNEYLIYRMFYPQAELKQKNTLIWVVKIKYRGLEFLVDNGFGKPSYYKEKNLRRFIIQPNYPDHYEKISRMTLFLKQNFLGDLTDAQIDMKLDELFLQ